MSAHTSKTIHQSIEAAMECLDLTLESELTLFRNRRSLHESEASEVTKEMTVRPLSPSTEQRSHAEQNDALPQPSENLADEAARLLDVSLEAFEIEESHSETSNPDHVLNEPFEEDFSKADSASDHNPAGALVPSPAPSKALLPSDGGIASSATLETYTDPALDDYLESSEVLLQHLDTPIAKRRPLDDSVSLKWFGWAAGVTLILSLFAAFFLQNMFKAPTTKDPENANDQSQTEVVQPASPTPPPKAAGPDGPDLSEKEFPAINPGNLGSLPAPEPKPSSPVPSTAPTPPNASSPNATPPPTPTGRQYYVVTNYTDEASLESAKQIVPEAQVVNFTAGTRIQLKQFSNEAEARTAAAQLKQQGLAVEILATAAE